jgi:hypothetical protein
MLWKHYKTLIFSRNHISDQVQTFFIVWNNIISRRYRYSCRACAAFLVQMLHPWLSLFPKKYFMLIYFYIEVAYIDLPCFFGGGDMGGEPIPNPHPARTLLTSYFDTVLWIGRHRFDAHPESGSVSGSGKYIRIRPHQKPDPQHYRLCSCRREGTWGGLAGPVSGSGKNLLIRPHRKPDPQHYIPCSCRREGPWGGLAGPVSGSRKNLLIRPHPDPLHYTPCSCRREGPWGGLHGWSCIWIRKKFADTTTSKTGSATLQPMFL